MNVKKLLLFLTLLLFMLPVQATNFVIPRLSPLPEEIHPLSLNGKWKFNPSPEEAFWKLLPTGWKDIEVPGEWVMQGFEVEKGKPAGYSRTFTIPTSWQGKRIKLRCNAIFSESTIYMNGEKVNYHLGGFTPFEIDITPFAHVGKENHIAIQVTSESVADSAASASRYAVHPLGGITRDIYLFALPEVNLATFHASTTFDTDYTNATLTAEVEVSNESNQSASNLHLLFTLTDAEGKKIDLRNNSVKLAACLPEENQRSTFSFDITKPEKWDSEHPYLYTFTCQLRDGDKVLQTTARRIGFRQIDVRGNELFINNMPVKLRGVCRHEVMPLRGRAVTGDTWKKDVELFRKGNVNYIRTSHYPPDEALLEACDELGMFVEMEAPFCWAHETKVPAEKHYQVLVNQHLEMVNRDKSHPSVIIWSMGNESNLYAEYFRQAAEIVKIIDPTRPRIFSQWGPDADNNELEIGNHHYPGPNGPNQYRNSKRPIVFDEFCHLNAYNRFELAADPGVRTIWGKLLDTMWNDMYNSKGVLGGALWAGIDDTFFLPDGRTVGYGTWGPIDGWRREKPEYWEMKKAFSPVRITAKQNIDRDGKLLFDIENRFNFTNLSACTIAWEIEGQTAEVAVDLLPRSKGSFGIQVPEPLRESTKIALFISDPEGNRVDEYEFRIAPEYKNNPLQALKGKIKVEETATAYIITVADIQMQVNRNNGLIDVLKSGKPYIQQAPALMILPLNGSGDGIQMTGKDQNYTPYNPLCENWICHAISMERGKDQLSVTVEGNYKEASGRFTYTLTTAAELSVSYQFTLCREVSPRQTGLVFQLPYSFTSLAWSRKGYWSTYPEDHIGALHGTAEAFNPDLPLSGIAGPEKEPSVSWSYDQTKSGSNIFRSTKENIHQVSLSDKSRHQLVITSDGTQHARAWIEGEQVKLLIADYNNPGSEGFLSSHAAKYYRPLKPGDRIEGTICLLLK